MNEKIDNLQICHFRGIPNEVSISFDLPKKAESALIFGDNGSGKSSIVDAIEYITQGTIEGHQSGKGGDWIYNSISLTEDTPSIVKLRLTNGEDYSLKIARNIEEYKIDGNGNTIDCFKYAPFILRRKDILTFWNLADQQKLKVFLKYAIASEKGSIPISSNEEMHLIEEERLSLKQKRRELLDEVCNYYHLNAKEMSSKSKGDFFGYMKLLNGMKTLKQLDKRHPQYGNLIKISHLYDEIAKANKKYREAIKKNEDENGVTSGATSLHREKLQSVMTQISPLITKAFKEISRTNNYVSEITISVASKTEMSLEFTVELENGAYVQPVMLFSEANRDLLALLVYFEFVYASTNEGQAKVLILDDVFQSVDSTIRFRVMQYVLSRFQDWQIIITTHDRLWKEQLVQLFRNHAKPLQQLEIMNWSFEEGPRIVASVNNFDEKLKVSMDSGSTADICASAGYLLEYMCEKLSFILSTSVKRRNGDRYTIGDLWPGIYKELKKTPAKECFSELNDLLYLRNMVGSHYNEWSLSLSRSEANDFANAVLEAYYHVCCKKCGRWIKEITDITEKHREEECCDKKDKSE